MSRRPIAALTATVAAATLALMPGTAMALLLIWTLDMTPSTVPVNQSSTFTLTATNNDLLGLQRLGCLEVDLPSSFVIEAAEVLSGPNGRWDSYFGGQAVVVFSENGGSRLRAGESVIFTIQALPMAPGAFTWPNHAHTREDCGGLEETGAPLNVTVLPAPTASPSPSPTPSPSPKPTASPAPTLPLPTLPLPTLPLPTVPLPTVPLATVPPSPHATPTHSPSPSPAPTASRPGDTATPEPSLSPGAGGPPRGAPPSQPPGSDGDPIGVVRLAPETGRAFGGLGVDLGLGNLLADMHVWSVPAVAIGVPGLLLIVWVALQTAGVLAWIPAVRRMRGDDRDRRHLRRN